MKKIAVAILTVLLAVSCLNGPSYDATDTIQVTFDYNDALFKDSLFFDVQYKSGYSWDGVLMYQKIEGAPDPEFKGGFMVSYLQTPASGETTDLSYNQYRSNVRTTSSVKNKYAVFCQTDNMPTTHLEFLKLSSGTTTTTCYMAGVFVTNTVEMEQAMKEAFEDGDRLVLKATGYLSGEKTDEAEFTLAEFTAAKDSILSQWTYFDLNKLGSVDKIMFDIQTPADKDLPKAVCMDSFIASINIRTE